MQKVKQGAVLVIGGGPAGCSAAWEIVKAGYEVTLVEQREQLGGMASSENFNGNNYEFGTHVFHTDQPELLARVKELMGVDLLEIDRGSNIHIKYEGRFFVYPLQGLDLLLNLPPKQAVTAVLSFLKAFLYYDVYQRRKPSNTEEYLIQKFGRFLYGNFFRDYSQKVWGMPCSELDASFGAQRIPRSDIFSSMKKLLDRFGLYKWLDHPLSESVIGKIYYNEHGIGNLYEAIGASVEGSGGSVFRKTTLDRLVVEGNRVRAVILDREGEEIEFQPDYVVLTIPIPVLVDCLERDIPYDVILAGRELMYRSVSLTGLLVARKQVRPSFFTYFPKLTFNRLSEPTNHGLRVSPDGHSLLIAETVCDYGDEAFRGEKSFCDRIVDEIEREGLLKKTEVVEIHPYRWRYAYPIYKIGFQKTFGIFSSYLKTLKNVHSIGRHGTFSYINMHVAMKMGIESVNKVQRYFA
jgi:protoporphyrinogen oxidase